MPWGSLLVSKVVCIFICPCFSNVFVIGAGAFSSKVIGELMVVLVRSLVTPSISVFPSPNVCVSLPLGLLLRLCFGCTVVSLGLVLGVLSSLPPPPPLLGRLCWLYCGFLGSELFFLECVCLPSLCSPRSPLLAVLWFSWLWVVFSWVCVSSFSLLRSVALYWLHCCFLRKVWVTAAHVCMLFFVWFVNSLLCCIY